MKNLFLYAYTYIRWKHVDVEYTEMIYKWNRIERKVKRKLVRCNQIHSFSLIWISCVSLINFIYFSFCCFFKECIKSHYQERSTDQTDRVFATYILYMLHYYSVMHNLLLSLYPFLHYTAHKCLILRRTLHTYYIQIYVLLYYDSTNKPTITIHV